jgi:hypothetical protein
MTLSGTQKAVMALLELQEVLCEYFSFMNLLLQRYSLVALICLLALSMLMVLQWMCDSISPWTIVMFAMTIKNMSRKLPSIVLESSFNP